MKTIWFTLSMIPAALLLSTSQPVAAAPFGPAFNYQGTLLDHGAPANGVYDFKITLFNALADGSAVGSPSTLALPAVPVARGTFNLMLDFGSEAFDGSDRWLEIIVQNHGNPGSAALLSPRQRLTSTPYANYAAGSGTAAIAESAQGFSGPLAGDIHGLQGSAVVSRLQGNSVSPSAPNSSGQVLMWNDASRQWEPNANFAGNGAGLDMLNASQLTSGTVPDARLSGHVALLDGANNIWSEHQRIGAITTAGEAPAGYGKALVLSGGPRVSSTYDSDNSNPLWLARFNTGDHKSELRVNIGDNVDSKDKAFVIGTTVGSDFNLRGEWAPKFSVDDTGLVRANALATPNFSVDTEGTTRTTALVTPNFSVDPSGAVTAGGYGFSVPVTRYLSIPATAFSPSHPEHLHVKEYDIFPSGPQINLAFEILAPVQLPHGATVIGMKATVYDASPTIDMAVWLVNTISDGTLAFAGTSEAKGRQVIVAENVRPTRIDNDNGSYVIQAIWEDSPGAVLSLRNVVISYTIDQPLP